MRWRGVLIAGVLGLVGCDGTAPMAPVPTVAYGHRAIVVWYHSEPVVGYPVTAWSESGIRSWVTDQSGALWIDGRCAVPVRVRSTAYVPGWMEPLDVLPCGQPYVVMLRPVGTGWSGAGG